jgi:hypothetical protein
MSEQAEYPLYGSTYTSYRTSPLYHGANPIFTNLKVHERRLRETLAGDALHTAQLGELLGGASNSGRLESCTWNLLGDEDAWERAQEALAEGGEATELSSDEIRGIHVEVRYEKARHSAILLGEASETSTTPGFTSLPLMLVRMPTALREVFLNFLSTSFDTRVTPMKLRPSFLTKMVENLLERTTYTEDEDPSFDIAALSKGIGIQLAFPSVAPLLKNLDLTIPKDDIREFLSRGVLLWQQHQTQTRIQAGLNIRPHSAVTGPFTAALSTYLVNNIALSLDNPGVVVSKIAMGPFALAGEGKIKVLGTSSAAVEFWDALLQDARGTGLEGWNKTVWTDEVLQETAGMRQRKMTRESAPSVPIEPPPPYELHDPARQVSSGSV